MRLSSIPAAWAIAMFCLSSASVGQLSTTTSRSLSWRQLGPMPGAGPEIYRIIENARYPDRLHAISPAGILESTDAGAIWSVRVPWPSDMVNSPRADVSPVDPDRIALPRQTFAHSLITHDGGATWWEPEVPPQSDGVAYAIFDPVDADVLYFSTTDGIWKSEDGGVVFEHVLETRGRVSSFLIDPNNRDRLYAFVYGDAFYLTLDGGRSIASDSIFWIEISSTPASGTRDSAFLLIVG